MIKKMIFLATVLGLMVFHLCYSQTVNITKIGEWGTGSYLGIFVQDNYAYCGTPAGLDIVDISEPTNPVKIGSCTTSGNAIAVAVSNNYAYVAYKSSGLKIIDISNPAAPVLSGSYDNLNYLYAIAVSGNYAFVTEWDVGLTIIDISNPTSPSLAGRYNLDFVFDVAISGKYAYLACSYNGFRIIDISNPGKPIKVGWYIPPITPSKVAISGNYAYLTGGSMGLKVLDISNPEAPSLVGSYENGINELPNDITVSGNYAYITYMYSLQIVDISNPKFPTLVCSYDTFRDPYGVVVQGNYAFLANGYSGLQVIDISNPKVPTPAGSYDFSGFIEDAAVLGNYAVVSNRNSGIQVIDISNPTTPSLVGTYSILFQGFAVSVSGNFAYVSDESGGLHIIDISNPAVPTLAGSLQLGRAPRNVVLSGNYAYVPAEWTGLHIIDISYPSSPTLVSSYDTDGSAFGVAVSGNYAYVADGGSGLQIIDISTPTTPSLVGSYDTGGYAYEAVISGHNAYVISWDTLQVIDISDPTAPTLSGLYDFDEYLNCIAVSGSYAYVGVGGNWDIQVIDVSNPHAPTLAGLFSTPGWVYDIIVYGNFVYVADGGSGKFFILSVSIDEQPSITVVSPNGGEVWQAGNTYNITWTQNKLSGNVTIDLYKGGSFHSHIGTAAANASVFAWNIPDNFTTNSNYKVLIYQDSIMDSSDNSFSIISPPPSSITLNRTRLNFGAVSSNTSPAQTIVIGNSGGGTLNWTAATDVSWLNVNPISGTGSAVVTVAINPSGLSAGTYIGTITISDPNALNTPQLVSVTLNIYNPNAVSHAFGEFATPINGSTVRSSIPVTGWVLDDIGVQHVKIYFQEKGNLTYIGDAVFVDGARPDVEQAYPDYPFNYQAGWGYLMLTNCFPNAGNGTFKIYAMVTDIEGTCVTLGVKTIHCDNANGVKPFGTIDTPTQGGSASGSSFVNWGWVLTPKPNSIPIDGSTITVWVDGVNIGHPTYNVYRSDIAASFPGYANSNGAAGYFYLDTTAYTNRVHIIQWLAADNAGNIDGIGSRYFSIQNSQSRTPARNNMSIKNKQGPVEVDTDTPVQVKKGFILDSELVNHYPTDSGEILVEIEELERLEIAFIQTKEVEEHPENIALELLSPLPIGAVLDAQRGIFYWMPGVGFVGDYSFSFLLTDAWGNLIQKNIRIRIRPKLKMKNY